jgi:hypothetical protein
MTKAMLALVGAMVISALGCKCGDDPCDPQWRRGDYRSPWRHHHDDGDDDDEVCVADGAVPADATPGHGDGGTTGTIGAGTTGGAADAGAAARSDAGGAHGDGGAAADAPCNDPPPAI